MSTESIEWWSQIWHFIAKSVISGIPIFWENCRLNANSKSSKPLLTCSKLDFNNALYSLPLLLNLGLGLGVTADKIFGGKP